MNNKDVQVAASVQFHTCSRLCSSSGDWLSPLGNKNNILSPAGWPPFWFLVLYWSFKGTIGSISNPLIFEKFNTGLQWYGQQSPCILCIASTKSLLGSYVLNNVHEKSLIERECELNYQKNSEQRGKKYLIFGIYNLPF